MEAAEAEDGFTFLYNLKQHLRFRLQVYGQVRFLITKV